jgi:hypothetical protein
MNVSNSLINFSFLVGMTGAILQSQGKAQEAVQPNLGIYGETASYCGAGAVARNPVTIPNIGCFRLSPGHAAVGRFSTHRVEVSVNSQGHEIFSVNGAPVVETHETASGTQLPYVGVGGVAGYRFCEGPTDRNTGCPVSITIFSRDADRTALFMVSECLPPKYRLCVTTQANWDYEKSRAH